MKPKLIILILLASISLASAMTAQFTGVITSVADTTLPVQVGDPFSAYLIFNNNTHVITRTYITVGLLHFNYPAEGTSFSFQNDPCEQFVSWQVSQSGGAHLTLQLYGQTACGDCVIPPLESFAINEWTFHLNGQTIGQLTAIPVIQ